MLNQRFSHNRVSAIQYHYDKDLILSEFQKYQGRNVLRSKLKSKENVMSSFEQIKQERKQTITKKLDNCLI